MLLHRVVGLSLIIEHPKNILSIWVKIRQFFQNLQQSTLIYKLKTKTNNVEKSTTQNTVANTNDEIVTSSSTNKEGKKLEMIFDNTINIATTSLDSQ